MQLSIKNLKNYHISVNIQRFFSCWPLWFCGYFFSCGFASLC